MKCIEDFNLALELSITLPDANSKELQHLCQGFRDISSNCIKDGCVSAMDGMLLRIKMLVWAETGNVECCYSGHYLDYGVYVHAMCYSK